MGYIGSEEFIRLQFEEYLLALLSSVSYHNHLTTTKSKTSPFPPSSPTQDSPNNPPSTTPTPTDPSVDFQPDFIHQWTTTTTSYTLFHSLTSDAPLFDIITPRHPTAGGLSVEDIQRRLAQQVSELHLDERMKEGREALNKTLATGQKTFAAGRERMGKLWADIEALREAQRKKAAERSSKSDEPALRTNVDRPLSAGSNHSSSTTAAEKTRLASIQQVWATRTQNLKAPNVDMKDVQERAQAARNQAGAYLSSWGNWANERRREWSEKNKGGGGISPSEHVENEAITAGDFEAPIENERDKENHS